jgi:hypothetical protein
MVEISLSGSGEGLGASQRPGLLDNEKILSHATWGPSARGAFPKMSHSPNWVIRWSHMAPSKHASVRRTSL